MACSKASAGLCGGCTCACITDEIPSDPENTVVVFDLTDALGPAQRILPPTGAILSCPSCMDIVFTGTLSNLTEDEDPIDVTLQLLVSNNATPDLVFGLAENAAPTVTLPYGSNVPIAVRYVTCQPAGSYSVYLQFSSPSTTVVPGGVSYTVAYFGSLTIAASKC